MFDSVLGHGVVPKSRFGTGAVVSVLLHVGVLGLAIYLSTRPPATKEKDVAVVLKVAPPPPPPPPPPPAATKQVKRKTNQLVQPKEIPQEKPLEAEPKHDEPPPPDGVPGGVEGGVAGGVIGGVVGGTGSIPFGEGMTRPKLISGGNGRELPDYTREAQLANIEGMMVVKCIITVEGRVQNCQIIKPLAHMDQAVLDWLAGSKYAPVTFQGRPTQVSYVFNFRFKMPK